MKPNAEKSKWGNVIFITETHPVKRVTAKMRLSLGQHNCAAVVNHLLDSSRKSTHKVSKGSYPFAYHAMLYSVVTVLRYSSYYHLSATRHLIEPPLSAHTTTKDGTWSPHELQIKRLVWKYK